MEILLSPPVLLTLAVIFVNGWTDAPNAIATAVGTGALRMGRAIALAAVCNLLGAVLSAALCPAVAATVLEIGDFSGRAQAQAALCAALLSIVLWAVAAWAFGIPTSESHALLAALSTFPAVEMSSLAALIPTAEWIRASPRGSRKARATCWVADRTTSRSSAPSRRRMAYRPVLSAP